MRRAFEIGAANTIISYAKQARSPRESGNVLIELALVLPICVLLLLGAVEFGRLTYAAIEVANAARAGAQYGVQDHGFAGDFGGIQAHAVADAGDVTGLTVNPSTFCVCSANGEATGASDTCTTVALTCVSPSESIEFLQVNVSAQFDPLIHAPRLPSTYTLRSQAVMRVLQ